MAGERPILKVVFFRLDGGREPVRDWLLDLPKTDRRTIGEDVKTVQFGWPMGMPLVRKIERDMWEIRSNIKDGITRLFFTVDNGTIILLHAFIKKSQSTPEYELQMARKRLKIYWEG